MQVIEKLEILGIPKNEATIYLALVKSGGTNASELAGTTGIYRPNIYELIKKLEEKELVETEEKEGKIFYKAKKIENLKDKLIQQMNFVKKISPELEKYKGEEKECEVSMYMGRRALRVMETDLLNTMEKEEIKETVVMGVDDRKFREVDAVVMDQYFEKAKKRGIKERVLVREGETYFPAPKEVTTYRMVPERYFDSTTSFVVTGDKVYILLFTEPLYLIIIKSKKIAASYKKKFELMWSISKPVRKR